MKRLLFLPLLTLPSLAVDSQAAFVAGARSILPPAQEAVAAPKDEAPAPKTEEAPPTPKTEAPAEKPKAEEKPAAPEASAASEEKPAATELTFTPDPSFADPSPAAHAEAYNEFKEKLKVQAEKNLYDFCPAMETVLRATNDEFAAEAWMEKAAKEGLPAAKQYVADRRLIHVRRDQLLSAPVRAAYKMVREAADAGYAPAKVNVYMCLKNGVGVEKNEKAADKYILEACKDGGFIPRFKWLQLSGRLQSFADRERPEVKGEISRGNDHVAYYLAMQAPSVPERVEWLQQAAKLGNAEAIYALSAMASAKDPKASLELLREAIKRHSSEAMFTLGTVLTEGNPESAVMKEAGLEHNDVLGRHLVRIASMTGSDPAHYWLGRVYHDGAYGVQQDDSRAFRHFEAGMTDGNASCEASMGLMQLMGLGTEKNEREGLTHLNLAANAGAPQAVLALAYAQYAGAGIPAQPKEAIKTLQEAAAMGMPEAYVYLAYITAKGYDNTLPDEREARHWVSLAGYDMKEKAQQLYDKLMAEGWKPQL